MRRLLALVLTATMPLAGVAQSLVPAMAPPQFAAGQSGDVKSAQDIRSVPLWGTADGRILALISARTGSNLDLPKSPQVGAPAEWRLIDVTSIVSAGTQFRLGQRANAHVDLSHSAIRPPLLASAALNCAFPQDANCANSRVFARTGSLRAGVDWLASENFSIDLYYGLSSLHRTPDAPAPYIAATHPALIGPAPTLPTLTLAGIEAFSAQENSLNALGRLRLSDVQSLDFGASLSRIELSIPGTSALTSLNQAALRFGLEYGSFSGNVTGRVLAPNELGSAAPGGRWSSLDIGFSWRTPWRGQLSIGAQNLWSSGSLPLATPPLSRDADPNQARIPYVQYHQDL